MKHVVLSIILFCLFVLTFILIHYYYNKTSGKTDTFLNVQNNFKDVILHTTPVKKQFKGTCWVFAAVDAIETLVLSQTGRCLIFSEQQFINCLGNFKTPNRIGGRSEKVLQFAAIYPLFLLSECPYSFTINPCQFPSNGRRPILIGYNKIDPEETNKQNGENSFDQKMYQLLMKNIPIIIHINYANLPQFRKVASQNVFIDSTEQLLNSVTDSSVTTTTLAEENFKHVHAVTVIGVDKQRYWICKNSWGSSWAQNGLFYLQIGSNALNYSLHPAFYPLLNNDSYLDYPVF